MKETDTVNNTPKVSYKVFISYSTNDMALVNRIRPALDQMRNMGVDIYVAEYSAPPGVRLDDHIKANISTCDMFCVLWSRNAKDSEWVSQEIGLAEACRRLIVPIVLDDKIPLPGFIKDRKYIPAGQGIDNAITCLRQIIAGNVNRKVMTIEQEKAKSAVALAVIGALLLVLLAPSD